MSYIEQAVFELLKSSTIQALVPPTSVYYQWMPDNSAFPAIVYSRASTYRQQSLSDKVSHVEGTWFIDAWSLDPIEAANISKALVSVLEAFRGVVAGVVIKNVAQEQELDIFETELRVFRKSHTYRISWDDLT